MKCILKRPKRSRGVENPGQECYRSQMRKDISEGKGTIKSNLVEIGHMQKDQGK